jgi:DNA-binding response OmpR family regulator
MRILVVEDEPEILKAYKIALEARGHEVILSEDGQAGFEEYKKEVFNQQNMKHNNKKSADLPIGVVVLDYRIPKMDGMEVAKRILKINPSQRIIFASAYVKETLEDAVKQLKQPVELLQKPFEPEVLVDMIEDTHAYEGLKSLITSIRGFDLDNPSPDQIRELFESLRKLQKGRTF